MTTKTRKQREREERENLFIRLARHMIHEEGYLGLGMDRLAERAEYSKGTIYQHFTTKEDLILAVAARNMEELSRLFRRAVAFEGRTRERFSAIGIANEIFLQRFPENPHVERIIHAKSLWHKTSEKWRNEYGHHGQSCLDLSLGVIQNAIEAGDLANERVTPFQVLMGVRSMATGSLMLSSEEVRPETVSGADAFKMLRHNQHFYLDGVRWHPLTVDWDYDRTYERILTEVFADESAEVHR